MSHSRAGGFSDPRRRRKIIMIVVVVAFLNFPALYSTWQRVQVDRSGVATTAEVVKTERIGEGYWISFRYGPEIDGERSQFPAEVDRATYERAEDSGEIGVRYLEERPSAYEVDGQQRHWAGLITTGIADLVLIAILLLVWRFGGRRRPLPLRMSASEDLEPCAPESLFEQVEGDLYLVRGEVIVEGEGEVWLDLDGQDVIVILDGHRNPVGLRESVQVRGRLLP